MLRPYKYRVHTRCDSLSKTRVVVIKFGRETALSSFSFDFKNFRLISMIEPTQFAM
jgi:hypothetical protein